MNQIEINEILKLLPHRYPFVLIDRILSYELGVKIQGLKNITFNEAQFIGHFPDYPVMPGVLILEAMAQTMGILVVKTLEDRGKKRTDKDIFYFAGIDGVRFKKPVTPGDQLILDVVLKRVKQDVFKADAVASVDGKTVCEAELMVAYRGQ